MKSQRELQKQWRDKKRAEGWVYFATLVPPELRKQFKRALRDWRDNLEAAKEGGVLQ